MIHQNMYIYALKTVIETELLTQKIYLISLGNSINSTKINDQRRKKLKMKKYLTQSKYLQNHYQIKNKVRLKSKDQKRNKMRYILKYYRILNRWKEP